MEWFIVLCIFYASVSIFMSIALVAFVVLVIMALTIWKEIHAEI